LQLNTQLSLLDVFNRLFSRFGPLRWWPAETPFEVCVGAILTQNTAWANVEKAIFAIKQAGIMSPEILHSSDQEQLAQLIRPAGYFNVKSRRLKDFTSWLFLNYQGSMKQMFAGDWHDLRAELLCVRGIGPETADSILLYAGHKPTFVVDAYTRRLFQRLGLLPEGAGYDETRTLFMKNLPQDVQLFNEYHAQIVEQCKRFCRTKALCNGCPLWDSCQSQLT
jgi:endonuclease-3 related protein